MPRAFKLATAICAPGGTAGRSPLGPALGVTSLPSLYWTLLAMTILAYLALTRLVKSWLHAAR